MADQDTYKPVVPPETAPEEAAPSPPVPSKPSKKATISTLKSELSALGLDTSGKKETLFKRLLAAFTRAQEEAVKSTAPRPRPPRQPHLSYLCFDVEGTCEAGTNFDYPNEIIEFPVVLLQWAEDDVDDDETASHVSSPSTSEASSGTVSRVVGGRSRRLHIIDTFHTYVRPTWRPKLSEFCTSLTGIQQSTIDAAPTFPEVLVMLEEWLDSWGLRRDDKLVDAMWVTDGPWDLRDFIPKQLHITPATPPRYPKYLLGPYLNVKLAVASVLSDATATVALGARGFKHTTRSKQRFVKGSVGPNRFLNIPGQLYALGLGSFSGRQHSGIDDATNIARVLIELTERDVFIESNAFLPPARNAKRWPWMGKPGEILWDRPMIEGMSAPASEQASPPSENAPLATDSASAAKDPVLTSEVAPVADVEDSPPAALYDDLPPSLSSEPPFNPAESSTPPPMVSSKKKKKKKTKKQAATGAEQHEGVADALVHSLEVLSVSTKSLA